MDHTNTRLQVLLDLYLADKASELEKDELWDYVHDPVYTDDLGFLLIKAYQADHGGNGMTAYQKNSILENIFEEDRPRQKGKLKLWTRIAGVAAVVSMLLVGVGIFYNQQNKHVDTSSQIIHASDILPGKNSATLTLANGKKIILSGVSKGELAREAGLSITKTADGQLIYGLERSKQGTENTFNTLSTAKGETYRVRLPDGSLVWLNAASSLTYAFALNERGERSVKLSGEAYFEVAKDKEHPFVVNTDLQQVRVLGTHFNVNSYADEPETATTLLEGAVQVLAGGNAKLLKPGQQARLGKMGVTVSEADVSLVTAWRDGNLAFAKTDIQHVMRQISRWYNVDVEYQGGMPDYTITGEVSRMEKLSSVLKVLELSEVHYELKGRKLIILSH